MDKELLQKASFSVKISDLEVVNDQFTKCKVKALYLGDNRNGSSLQQATVERALPSMKLCPIVGEFSEDANDFKGHGGKIVIDENGMKWVHTTKPYGVVSDNATFEWVDEMLNGEMKRYLVVDGVYLWTGRYEEARTVIENSKNHSMEIDVRDGEWRDDDIFEIKDFVFTALCILGDDVEPCFEDSNISASFSVDEFKSEFTLMMDELKASLSSDSKENEINYQNANFALQAMVEDFQRKEGLEDGEDKEDQEGNEEVLKFQALYEEEHLKYVELLAEHEAVKEQLTLANEKIGNLTSEVEQLQATVTKYQLEEHRVQAMELITKFEDLDENDVKDIVGNIDNLTLEEIEDKCFILVGKKKATFSLNKKESLKVTVSGKEKEPKRKNPYGNLFD